MSDLTDRLHKYLRWLETGDPCRAIREGDDILLVREVIAELEAAQRELAKREQWNKPDCCVENETQLRELRSERDYLKNCYEDLINRRGDE